MIMLIFVNGQDTGNTLTHLVMIIYLNEIW